MTRNKHTVASWVRPLYLYAACLVAVVVFIIGTVTIGQELIRRYVFGLQSNWYENPRHACEYILTSEELPPYDQYAYGRGPHLAKPVGEGKGEKMSEEERQERYERCLEIQAGEIAMRSRYDLANDVSRGLTMILVAVPIFWLHWRLIQKEWKS